MTSSAGKQSKVLVMAGGTGGHVYPGLATAGVLSEQGVTVEWLGSERGIENELVPAAGFPLHTISVTGLRGKGIASLLLAPFKLLKACLQAKAVLQKVKPNAVLGMGGFASGPGGLAAKLMGIPVLVHEQNAIPGMTNKTLAKFAKVVMEAFPNTFPQAICTGNPIRKNIVELSEPDVRFQHREGPIRVLVVGGSLGAQAINLCVPKALAALTDEQMPEVWHQTGKRNYDETKSAYQAAGVNAKIAPFIDDMNQAYDWADVVICRAGALTVSELSAAGVASVLIPFPYAVDDHQTANARFLSEHQAGILLPQTELTTERLVALLKELSDRPRLLEMAMKARSLGQQNASELVAQQCMRWAGVED